METARLRKDWDREWKERLMLEYDVKELESIGNHLRCEAEEERKEKGFQRRTKSLKRK